MPVVGRLPPVTSGKIRAIWRHSSIPESRRLDDRSWLWTQPSERKTELSRPLLQFFATT